MVKKLVLFEEVKNIIEDYTSKNKEFLENIDFVIGMSRGGLIPAAMLATTIDKPLIAAYIDKNDEIFFDRENWIKGKDVLVVDDIIRSGKTLWRLKKYLEENSNPANISFVALFKVKSLEDRRYNFPLTAGEINNDMAFPWDN